MAESISSGFSIDPIYTEPVSVWVWFNLYLCGPQDVTGHCFILNSTFLFIWSLDQCLLLKREENNYITNFFNRKAMCCVNMQFVAYKPKVFKSNLELKPPPQRNFFHSDTNKKLLGTVEWHTHVYMIMFDLGK